MNKTLFITLSLLLILVFMQGIMSKSVILANYYNVVLFYPSEYGGNDDLRIVFDIRNISSGTFKYTPIIVDVAYDSTQNIAYCYLESAVKSYIVLLKWFSGKWCYQIIFEFESSTYSNYMYHSLVTIDNFVYWTMDRYIMSGRVPGYEQRRLMQPGWERIYRMTIDKPNRQLYVASLDFGENVIYTCSILRYSCVKLTQTSFAINSIFYDSQASQLYIGSVQVEYLYKYSAALNALQPVTNVKTTVYEMSILPDNFGVFTDRETLSICKDIRLSNCIRFTRPRLVDPYTIQYVFTFDHVSDFDSYPYPYSDFHDILWKDKQYLFHLHILGLDYVENDNAFLPEMDLNNNFLHVESCTNIYFDSRTRILVPSLIAGGAALFIIIIAVCVCICKSKKCCCFRDRLNARKTTKKSLNQTQATTASMRSGSTIPLKDSSTINSKEKLKRKYPTQVRAQINPNLNNALLAPRYSSNENLNNQSIDKTHSSGIYIMGKNLNQRNSPHYYNSNNVESETDVSYINPRYITRLPSKPVASSKYIMNNYRFSNTVPIPQLDISQSADDDYSHHHQCHPHQQAHKAGHKASYISSLNIPLYGSNIKQNYISIKKAVNVTNDQINDAYPDLSDDIDMSNMISV